MKFDRSNKFDFCYYGQVNSLRLKTRVASKWASKHFFGGTIYFAGKKWIVATIIYMPLFRLCTHVVKKLNKLITDIEHKIKVVNEVIYYVKDCL